MCMFIARWAKDMDTVCMSVEPSRVGSALRSSGCTWRAYTGVFNPSSSRAVLLIILMPWKCWYMHICSIIRQSLVVFKLSKIMIMFVWQECWFLGWREIGYFVILVSSPMIFIIFIRAARDVLSGRRRGCFSKFVKIHRNLDWTSQCFFSAFFFPSNTWPPTTSYYQPLNCNC